MSSVLCDPMTQLDCLYGSLWYKETETGTVLNVYHKSEVKDPNDELLSNYKLQRSNKSNHGNIFSNIVGYFFGGAGMGWGFVSFLNVCSFLFSQIRKEPPTTDITSWKCYQIVHFLDNFLSYEAIPVEVLARLSDCYPQVSQTHNAEVCKSSTGMWQTLY